jgi:hypothetical protein
MKSVLTTLLLTAACVSGCDKKDIPDKPVPPIPFHSKIELKQTDSEAGTPDVTTTRTFLFTDEGDLRSFTVRHDYSVGDEGEETVSTVTRTEGTVTIDNGRGSVAVYTLGDNGCAASCVLTEGSSVRNYTFEYVKNALGQPLLSRMTETMRGNATGSVALDYRADNSVRITATESEYTFYYIATPAAEAKTLLPNSSLIPCLFVVKRYPLSFHEAAYYGRLLGAQHTYLIGSIRPEGMDEEVAYTYETDDEGIVTRCRETTTNRGRPYTRTVDYTIE